MNAAFTVPALALAGCFISSAASAQDIPRYSAEAYCREVSEVSGGSSMIYGGCIDMEQTAYNSLKREWAGLPIRARTYCDEVARVSGGSYSILQGCIDMELDAANNTPAFEY